jgi:hypothetical protein
MKSNQKQKREEKKGHLNKEKPGKATNRKNAKKKQTKMEGHLIKEKLGNATNS